MFVLKALISVLTVNWVVEAVPVVFKGESLLIIPVFISVFIEINKSLETFFICFY